MWPRLKAVRIALIFMGVADLGWTQPAAGKFLYQRSKIFMAFE